MQTLLLTLIARLGLPALAPLALASPHQSQALEQASPEARAAWQRLCAVSASPAREPITAFHLKADIRTRSGVQTNDTRIDYRYLAPDCIRFMLPSRNETGRFGPAQEQYWLKAGKEVVTLAGREYEQDRRQVDDMLALSRNYVALSNPSRMNLQALEFLASAPLDLGEELTKSARKLTWLALESPDFALVRRDGAVPKDSVYRVELGLRENGLPGIAVIRAKTRGGGDPLLVEFGDYQEKSGFQIPVSLKVHVLEGRTPNAFSPHPSQEVYVTEANLRPELRVEDFKP